MAIYTCKERIDLEDVGYSNKITNKAILKILENAGARQSEAVHFGLNDMENVGFSWILLGWKVQVLKRPIYNEELTVKTWGRDANRIFTYRDYEIYDENNELCTIATSKWAIVDIKAGKLKELTSDIIGKYQCEPKKVFEQDYTLKLKEPETVISKQIHKAQRRDIDINKHIHNLCYLDYAYEALPDEIYEQNECNNIEIMYKKQIKLGDEFECMYTMENNENIITLKSADENTLHAIVKLY